MGLFDWVKKKKKGANFTPRTHTDYYFYDICMRAGIEPTEENFFYFKQDLEPLYIEKMILKAYNSLEKEEDRQQFDEFIKKWDELEGTEDEKIEKMIDFVKKMDPDFDNELKEMETEFADEYLQAFDEENGESFADCEECKEHCSHCECCREEEHEVEDDDCDDSSDDCDDCDDSSDD
jgi:hypothetical protein